MRRANYVGEMPAFGSIPVGMVGFFASAPTPTAAWQLCDLTEVLYSTLPSVFKNNAPVGPSKGTAFVNGASLSGLDVTPQITENPKPFLDGTGQLTWANFRNAQSIVTTDGFNLAKAMTTTLGGNPYVGLMFANARYFALRDPGGSSSTANRLLYWASSLAGPWTAGVNNGSICFESYNGSSTWLTAAMHDIASDGGSIFCVVGQALIINTSPDSGANWTRRKGGTTGTESFRSVVYNGTEFVCLRRAGLDYIPSASLGTITTLAYSSDTTKFPGSVGPTYTIKVGATYYGWDPQNANTCYWTSTDARTWTKVVTAWNVNAMAWDSTNGRIWAYTRSGTPALHWMVDTGGTWTDVPSANFPASDTTNEYHLSSVPATGRLLLMSVGLASGQPQSFNDQSLYYDFPLIASIGPKAAYMRTK